MVDSKGIMKTTFDIWTTVKLNTYKRLRELREVLLVKYGKKHKSVFDAEIEIILTTALGGIEQEFDLVIVDPRDYFPEYALVSASSPIDLNEAIEKFTILGLKKCSIEVAVMSVLAYAESEHDFGSLQGISVGMDGVDSMDQGTPKRIKFGFELQCTCCPHPGKLVMVLPRA